MKATHHHKKKMCLLAGTFRLVFFNPCGNFSDTSGFKPRKGNSKGSIGHAFTVCIRTGNRNQMSFYPSVLHEISVPVELILGHLRYLLTDVPPQPNSPPDYVFNLDPRGRGEEAVVPRDPSRPPSDPPASREDEAGRPARGEGGAGAARSRCVHVFALERGAEGARFHPIK